MTLIADVFPKLQAAKDVLPKMPKSPRFRTPCDSQHVNGSETLVKSAWQHFYDHIIMSETYLKIVSVINYLC